MVAKVHSHLEVLPVRCHLRLRTRAPLQLLASLLDGRDGVVERSLQMKSILNGGLGGGGEIVEGAGLVEVGHEVVGESKQRLVRDKLRHISDMLLLLLLSLHRESGPVGEQVSAGLQRRVLERRMLLLLEGAGHDAIPRRLAILVLRRRRRHAAAWRVDGGGCAHSSGQIGREPSGTRAEALAGALGHGGQRGRGDVLLRWLSRGDDGIVALVVLLVEVRRELF